MARISQEQSQERHSFLLELFRNQPDVSRTEAMEAYKDKFGASLNAKTFNELREQARDDAEASDNERSEPSASREPEPEPESDPSGEDIVAQLKSSSTPAEPVNGSGAQPAAKKPKAKGTGPKNIFVDASQEHLQFLERVVQQLQEAGANNLRIDHSTDRWMVLTVDSK